MWTVLQMTRVMAEEATIIRIEPPDEEGVAAEFWVQTGYGREYHQAKLQAPGRGNWTVARLDAERVLAGFRTHLEGSADATCVFVSTHPAHPLDELADRARSATSPEEFERQFLTSQDTRNEFDALCRTWGGNATAQADRVRAFELLRQIRVETISQTTLRQIADAHLDFLIDGDAATARDVLALLAVNSVHRQLTPHDIWHHLESRPGFARRQWANDPHLLPAVGAATDRYLRLVDEAAIGGVAIPRHEADKITDVLRSAEHRRVLASGVAGSGKSGVLAQVVRRLREDGWPVLTFRLDRLTPTPRPSEVGAQLGLPGSPAQVLAAVAGDRDSLLVIDQLDAVSKASGRNPQFLECMTEIIDQAAQHPRVRVVLACRDFDLQNDDRLRRLLTEPNKAERIGIGMFTADVVRNTVAGAGLDADALTERQLRLLELPLHLSLLWQVAERQQAGVRIPDTVRELYDAYWDEKQSRLREDTQREVAWNQVIDALCAYMSEHQELSAPESVIDDHRRDALAMASEHVLTIRDKRVQFFHESFFDYAFARRFAAHGDHVLGLVLSGEQHLFRRAQVRQILSYERAEGPRRYLADLRALLTDPQIRFHIKRVVCDVLAQLSEPMDGEWQILSEALASAPSPMAQAAWSVLWRSAPWFRLLDGLGIIEQWLAGSNDAQVDRTVSLLWSVQRTESARIAQIIEPYVGKPGSWERRLRHLVRLGDVDASREYFDLFLRLVDRGIVGSTITPPEQIDDFWAELRRPAERHPEWTCEAIGRHFRRRLAVALKQGQTSPFEGSRGGAQGGSEALVLEHCAWQAPLQFVREVLPTMLQIMELTAEEGDPPRRDRVWCFRTLGMAWGTDQHLLRAMERALSRLAEQSPDVLASVVHEHDLDASPFETVQFLLIRAYAANGPEFADHAVDYLCQLPARLGTGYIDGEHGMYWASRELVQAVTPHCSLERLQRLEDVVLDYYPDVERKAGMQRYHGHAQLVLLDAIDPARRSARATARLKEWQRKFETTVVAAPRGAEVWAVPSPISPASAERMSDRQWLSAIRKYGDDEDRLRRRGSDGHPIGGAHELSGVLREQAKADPERFCQLMLRLPDDADPAYFTAILDGLAEASAAQELLLTACRHAHGLPSRPVGHAIVRLIENVADLQAPDDVLDVLVWYATADPDPDKELWRTEAASGDVYYGGDIVHAGLNSTRGRAAEAVAVLLFREPKLVPRLHNALERMVGDPIIAVRAWVAYALVPVLNYDRDLGVELFLRLCQTEDVLLGTRFVEEFLSWALRTHFMVLRPVVERMLGSNDPRTAEAGARQACLAGLYVEGAQDMVERCLSGREMQRVGAAQVLAANLGDADFRAVCVDGLSRLFNDPSEKVQDAAAGCFRKAEGLSFADFTDLALQFIESSAYGKHYGDLAFALKQSPTAPPDLICTACEQFLNIAGSEAGDIAQGAAFESSIFSELVFRAYASTDNEEVRSRCLDMVDRLTEAAAYGVEKPLQEYDR
jgi:hypothetical protein